MVFDGTSQKNALADAGFGGSIADVEITSGYTGVVGLGRDLTVTSSFVMGGGTLTGANTLTINQGASLDWLGGTMLGFGTTRINADATMRVLSADAMYLNGWRLENAGTIIWGDTGNLYALGATIENQLGGTFEVGASTTFQDSALGLSSFINDGTFRTLGAVGVTVNMYFRNSNAIEVAAGGLTFSNLDASGTIDSGGIVTLTDRFLWRTAEFGDSSESGSGQVILSPTVEAYLTLGVDRRLTNIPMLNQGQVTWNSGDLVFSGPRAIFTNTGDFLIANINQETNAVSMIDDINIPGGEFHNLSDGLVVMAGEENQRAEIRITNLVNDGVIVCDGGTLSIQSSGEHTGEFDVAADGTIEFNGFGMDLTNTFYDPVLLGTPILWGSGLYRVTDQMTLAIESSDLTPQKFELAAKGILAGSGKLRPTHFEWLAEGTIQDATVIIPSSGELHITEAGDRVLDGGNIVIQGIATWDDGNIIASTGALITVDGSAGVGKGVFNVKNDGKIQEGMAPPGSFTIKNNGILQKSAGNGETDIQMDVEIETGGKIDLKGRDLKTKSLKISGLLELNGGTLAVAANFQQDSGSTTLGGGILSVAGASIVNAGTLALDNGTIIGPNGVQIMATATVSGSGTIEGDVLTAGMWMLEELISPPASLSITGYFTQTGGRLDILSGNFEVVEHFTKTAGLLAIQGNGTLSVGGNVTVHPIFGRGSGLAAFLGCPHGTSDVPGMSGA